MAQQNVTIIHYAFGSVIQAVDKMMDFKAIFIFIKCNLRVFLNASVVLN